MTSSEGSILLKDVRFEDWKSAVELADKARFGGTSDTSSLLANDPSISTALAYMVSWRLLMLGAGLNPTMGLNTVLSEGLYPRVHAITPGVSYGDLYLLISGVGSGDSEDFSIEKTRNAPELFMGLVGALYWYDETFIELERHLYKNGFV